MPLRLCKNNFFHPGCCALFFIALVCFVLLSGPRALAASASGPEKMVEEFERQRRAQAAMVEAGTVFIVAGVRGDGEFAIGSGFCVADGYIMTNAHVIQGALKDDGFIFVINDTLPLTKATIVDIDYHEMGRSTKSMSDLALLRITPPKGISLPVLGFTTDIRRTDRINAWGYPSVVVSLDDRYAEMLKNDGASPPPLVYSEGTISSLIKGEGCNLIVHSAIINPGNSGGPLTNRKGEVVGINTWNIRDDDAVIYMSQQANDVIAFLGRNGIKPTMGAVAQSTTAEAAPAGGYSMFPSTSVSDAAGGDSRVTGKEARDILVLAEKNDKEAMVYVGFSYLDGSDGFPEDLNKARHWLEQAAKAGEPNAMGMAALITLYGGEGRGTPEALAWLRKSAESDGAENEFKAYLSAVLYEGEAFGLAPDYEESYKWADIAAKAGDALAKAILGFHCYDGIVVKEDMAKALSLAEQSAGEGESKGKALLATVRYTKGEKNFLQPAREAAEDGERSAQGLMAFIYATDPDYIDHVAAERMARQAAGQADYMGCYVLGWLYYKGLVVEKNLPQAWAYVTYAEEHMVDPGLEEGGELRAILEKQLSSSDKQRGEALRKALLAGWGLSAEL